MPSLNCAGAGGSLAPRSTTAPAGSALAACAVAQAQSGSLILAATGAPAAAPTPVHSLVPLTHVCCIAAGEVKLGGLGRDAEELLRQHLKRRHAASLLSLKEEFMRKRKKGRLPKDATEALKAWWQSNLVWPYPSVRVPVCWVAACAADADACAQDDDKRALGDDTGLNATQINNCAFTEWREAHSALTCCVVRQGSSTSASGTGTRCVALRGCWHARWHALHADACGLLQLFVDGPPASAEEAHRVRAAACHTAAATVDAAFAPPAGPAARVRLAGGGAGGSAARMKLPRKQIVFNFPRPRL